MSTATSAARSRLRRYSRWLVPASGLPLAVIGTSWWLTEPLEPAVPDRVASLPPPAVAAPAEPSAGSPTPAPRPTWPEERLEGQAAKEVLLGTLLVARERLGRVAGYTATFRKRERIRGKLGPEQTLAMKVRHEPFSIYLKFLKPKAGKEVVYRQGAHDNHVIAHNGDWTRRLIPRLKVAPTDPLALADSRHPVTDAGLLNLTDRLIGFRRMDLEDEHAETVLDRLADEQGRTWLRSVHSHPHFSPARPFKQVEVLYDPETYIPHKITSFDWPEPGDDGTELKLAESYAYDDVDLDSPLTDADFDPANPEYAFTRF
jgi:hypothetical protein